MVTGHRPRHQGSTAGEEEWWAGDRGKGREGVKGAARAKAPPLRGSPLRPDPHRRCPSPGSSRPRPRCRRAPSWARAPGPSQLGPQPLLKQQLPPPPPPWPGRWGPTSLPPAPPPYPPSPCWRRRHPPLAARGGRDVDALVLPLSGRSRPSEELASSKSRATWGPQTLYPGQRRPAANLSHHSLLEAPTWGLRSAGRGLGSLRPLKGDVEIEKGTTSPTVSPSGSGERVPPPHNPSPGFGGCKCCKGSSVASVLQSRERN
ncbi:proline-rich protein 2-like [Manis pentadactyla]|uniref:proline-rich protein 2-like n=1 Tax=Manis pentadactyla TaxID=143292 RepID=UPI00255C71C3|nr:proline-rich protein 2-like [Manis pentadactyla]